MTKLKAASMHLALSAVVASALFTGLWFVWYPFPLFQAVGALNIFLVLLCVDVVLGPVLTLIVFVPGKKCIKFDLAAISMLQIGALALGLHSLWTGRPVYVAALGHRFDLVQASDVDTASLVKSAKPLPLFGPILVGTATPSDKKLSEEIMFGGADLGALPAQHVAIEKMRDELLARSKNIDELIGLNSGEAKRIHDWIKRHGKAPNEVVYQGLKARAQDMAIILDAKTAKVIGIAPFKPWP